MSIGGIGKISIGRANSIVKYPRLHAGTQFSWGKRVAVVYGSCQAEPSRQLLAGTGELEYELAEVTPVHLISRRELGTVTKIAAQAHLFIHQQVKVSHRTIGPGVEPS